jgi:hypothetical protein
MEQEYGNPYRMEGSKQNKRRQATVYLFILQLSFLAVIGLSFFVYFSWRPRMRLMAEPPAQFLAGSAEWNVRRRSAEQPIARAYWDCAVKLVQWAYPFGTALPPTPPPEFQIHAQELPNPTAATPESRDYYWQRLREAWPEAWRKAYVWDTGWISDFINNLRSRVPSLPGL